jgi:hypothetical protein
MADETITFKHNENYQAEKSQPAMKLESITLNSLCYATP